MKQNTSSSENVVVKVSDIHGHGLFAAKEIKSGEIVVRWNKRELSEYEYASLTQIEKTYIDIQGSKIFLMGEPERYVNHSCVPNTISGQNCDIASRDIKKGEEITADYKYFYIPNGQFQCICGSENCRGTVFGSNSEPSANC